MIIVLDIDLVFGWFLYSALCFSFTFLEMLLFYTPSTISRIAGVIFYFVAMYAFKAGWQFSDSESHEKAVITIVTIVLVSVFAIFLGHFGIVEYLVDAL